MNNLLTMALLSIPLFQMLHGSVTFDSLSNEIACIIIYFFYGSAFSEHSVFNNLQTSQTRAHLHMREKKRLLLFLGTHSERHCFFMRISQFRTPVFHYSLEGPPSVSWESESPLKELDEWLKGRL